MRNVEVGKTGLAWNMVNKLRDLEFADDVCLLTESRQLETKLEKLSDKARDVVLNLNVHEIAILKTKKGPNKIEVDGRVSKTVEKSTYRGVTIEKNGEAKADTAIWG